MYFCVWRCILMYLWREMYSTSTYSTAILFSLTLVLKSNFLVLFPSNWIFFHFFPPYHKLVISNSFRHHWFFRCTEQASMKTPWNFYHEWFGGMVHENSFSSAWQWSKWSIISRITLLVLQSFTKRNIKNINFNADFNQGQKAMSKIRAFFFMNWEWNMTYTE